ncbi:MAG TPA: 23S rRNA (guanosine(2251)-2'-O)-methyltransferase RlmB [Chloroflexi bacterium]|nr:23S rRNA (guanosine(2251)-2'-O)-methyltransferase RlmB [Chloroflexota bacterium]
MENLVGRNPVHEALRAGRRRIERVLLAEGVAEKGTVEHIVALCRQRRVAIERVSKQEIDRLSGDVLHQGVAAHVSPYPYVEIDDILAPAREGGEMPFVLALDSLQDPQNVGSLMRTAEAVGVHGVILPDRRAVGVTPAVSRASAGAVEHLQVAMVKNLVRTLDELKERGLWIAGGEDHPEAVDYTGVDLNRPLALVLGSEGRGMRRLVAERCDFLLRIPMRGRVGSLNVSVAGGILLYRAWHARQSP